MDIDNKTTYSGLETEKIARTLKTSPTTVTELKFHDQPSHKLTDKVLTYCIIYIVVDRYLLVQWEDDSVRCHRAAACSDKSGNPTCGLE